MSNGARPDETLRGEDAIIQRYFAPLAAGAPGALSLKDDCALLTPEPGSEYVLKTDPIAAGIHFLVDDAPEDIAWKALAVNVSDLAAKAATPVAYLMALSFPTAPTGHWLSRFAAGLAVAQARFGCHLIGGDTDRRPGPLTVSISIIGSVPQGRMVRRATAQAGDAVFVSGTIGDAALGLAARKTPTLASSWALTAAEAEHLRIRYVRPEPRLAIGPALRACASAAMDISDGLAKDLARLCAASNCAGRVRVTDIPLSPAAARALAADPGLVDRIVAGGDDYEILAAVPAGNAQAFQSFAYETGVPLTQIGVLSKGSGLVIEGQSGRPLSLARRGWDHF